jgi:hypothetical protein
MLCCDLGQINSIPNQNGTFLDLIFSNACTGSTVEICESPLLGLDRHHRAYELLMDVQICKFEATSMDERRFRFRATDFFMMLYGLVLKNLWRVVPRNFRG